MPQRSTSIIRIPTPCAESWDAMTPTGLGRHCTACQKTVVDFTQKTDAEILAVLRQAAGGTCGRLRADQLGRSLVTPTSPSRWRAWLGAMLAVGSVLGASRASAQSALGDYHGGPVPAARPAGAGPAVAPPSPLRPAEPPLSSNQTKTEPGGPLVLRGTVTDSTTHEGLPGVTVLLAGTTIGTSTDVNGEFSLPLAASAGPVHLVFSSVGYTSQERTITANSPTLSILMTPDTHMLGEMGIVVVGGFSYKRPWPWHPRRFFNWSKYWLTRPFRS
jgi:hypothetical protein